MRQGSNERRHEKTNILRMRKQRRGSAPGNPEADQRLSPKLKLCLFHLTRPTHENTPRPENFYSYFVLKIIFFFVYFAQKSLFSMFFYIQPNEMRRHWTRTRQPIICLVLQEPPETIILLADIFSSVAATWNPFLTFVFDKNDRFQCRKGSELADAPLSF